MQQRLININHTLRQTNSIHSNYQEPRASKRIKKNKSISLSMKINASSQQEISVKSHKQPKLSNQKQCLNQTTCNTRTQDKILY